MEAKIDPTVARNLLLLAVGCLAVYGIVSTVIALIETAERAELSANRADVATWHAHEVIQEAREITAAAALRLGE